MLHTGSFVSVQQCIWPSYALQGLLHGVWQFVSWGLSTYKLAAWCVTFGQLRGCQHRACCMVCDFWSVEGLSTQGLLHGVWHFVSWGFVNINTQAVSMSARAVLSAAQELKTIWCFIEKLVIRILCMIGMPFASPTLLKLAAGLHQSETLNQMIVYNQAADSVNQVQQQQLANHTAGYLHSLIPVNTKHALCTIAANKVCSTIAWVSCSG